MQNNEEDEANNNITKKVDSVFAYERGSLKTQGIYAKPILRQMNSNTADEKLKLQSSSNNIEPVSPGLSKFNNL
jgi:hypothetical protein